MSAENPRRWLWPALCALLPVAIVAGIFEAWRLHEERPQKERSKSAPLFDKRERAYFEALADALGYQLRAPLTTADAARLAAYERIELNKRAALARGGEPTTFPDRDVEFVHRATVPLAPEMSLTLDAPFTHYRYELVNRSGRAQPAPILFQSDRWDSAEALVAAAGFKNVGDEIERALAIWRFVCPRRVFGEPVTEGSEEHDVIKFLACYGYGFCDDTARALAVLAELSGLQSRVWQLDGHVVAEVLAAGRWRMLDADQGAYFHRAGAPREVLGVEELAAERGAFAHSVFFRGAGEYSTKYRDAFLSREDNRIAAGGTAQHRLEPILRPGEKMAFTNGNWGRYFLGKFPTPPPRFFNGTFTYALRAGDLTAAMGILVEPGESGVRLRNAGATAGAAELRFKYPFPLVGGAVRGAATVTGGAAQLRLEDAAHGRVQQTKISGAFQVSLDRFFAVLTPEPTTDYTVAFVLDPGAVLELREVEVMTDFQFAPMALLPLKQGANSFRAHFPAGGEAAAFELRVLTK